MTAVSEAQFRQEFARVLSAALQEIKAEALNSVPDGYVILDSEEIILSTDLVWTVSSGFVQSDKVQTLLKPAGRKVQGHYCVIRKLCTDTHSSTP